MVADVTYLSLAEPAQSAPLHGEIQRFVAVPADFSRVTSLRQWLPKAAPWFRVPIEYAGYRALAPESERILRDVAATHDVIWVMSGDDAHVVVPSLKGIGTPLIVDVVDVEAEKVQQALDALRSKDGLSSFHDFRLRLFMRLKLLSWRRWLAQLDNRVDIVVLAKTPEVPTHLRKLRVVPNGCSVPPFRGAREVHRPVRILFYGRMRYGPNADAARWLTHEIAPMLVDALGEVEVRVVGEGATDILHGPIPSAVRITGYVEDIASEVAGTDIVLVPLRFGSGTRIKILEALAQQVPVVSTSIGCEGLGAIHHRDLLVANTPEEMAAACAELRNLDLRNDLVTNAYVIAQAHDWSVVESEVAHIVEAAVERSL
jgi:glycosyltransferase involved in cell wall biosynthesis